VKYEIKNFKFKLHRQLISKCPLNGKNTVEDKIIFQKKEAGVGAGKSSKREFIFEIPKEFTPKYANQTKLQKYLQLGPKTEPVVGSWLGQVFCIDYVMVIFVKHDKWD
jgi:hypothetical protein